MKILAVQMKLGGQMIHYLTDKLGHELVTARDYSEAGQILSKETIDCVIVRMVGSTKFLTTSQILKCLFSGIQVFSGIIWATEVLLPNYPRLAGRVIVYNDLHDDEEEYCRRTYARSLESDVHLIQGNWRTREDVSLTEILERMSVAKAIA